MNENRVLYDKTIDKSINKVTEIIDTSLNNSKYAETEQNEFSQQIENVWKDIQQREDAYSDYHISLVKVRSDLNKNKQIFEENFKNITKNLDEKLEKLIKLNDNIEEEWEILLKRKDSFQNTSNKIRENLIDMNELEIKYRQQILATEQILDKIRITVPKEKIFAIKNNIIMIKKRIEKAKNDEEALKKRINNIQSNINKNKDLRNKVEDQKYSLLRSVRSNQEVLRVEKISERKKEIKLFQRREEKNKQRKELKSEKECLMKQINSLEDKIEANNKTFKEQTNKSIIKRNSIDSKKKEISQIKEEENIYKRIEKVDTLSLQKEIERIKKEKQKILEETKKEEENFILFSRKALRMEEMNNKLVEGISKYQEEAEKLNKESEIVEKGSKSIDEVYQKRNRDFDSLITTLNDLYSQIEYKKNESMPEISEYNVSISFTSEEDEMKAKVQKQKKINKKLKKLCRIIEESLTKYRIEQKEGEITKLENTINKAKTNIQKRKGNINIKIINIFSDEKTKWMNISKEEATETLCFWSDEVSKLKFD